MATDPKSPALPKPLFDLGDVEPRAFITMNGQPYDLLRNSQLSILKYHEMSRFSARLDALLEAPALNADEAVELEGLLKRCTAIVLQAPPDILELLTDQQRLKVCLAFSQLSQATPATARATTPTPARRKARSTGAKKSRASSGSTAGRRMRG